MTESYGDEARARLVSEPNKRQGRTPFERDRARVLHSAALRRLSAKTQVMGAGTDDFVRNRLTHSLEVAQVARELGKSIGCDPDVVDSAALAHDLGHPPFGHNGEAALNVVAQSCGGFEGNAQTLRILTRLESKTFDAERRSVGLNLTRASLDACVKYPWTRANAGAAMPKFGVYDDDLDVFGWLRDRAEDRQRCVEAQVMDFADDVAYSVHDVEDGVVGQWFSLEDLDTAAAWGVAREWYAPQASDDRLDAALGRLRTMPEWPERPFDGTRRSRALLKRLTSALIGRFVYTVEAATMDRWGSGPHTRYGAQLEVPQATRDETIVLKSIAAHYVMRSGDRADNLRAQQELITALAEALAATGDQHLESEFCDDFAAAADDRARLRVVIDQVASLTDPSAHLWAQRLLS